MVEVEDDAQDHEDIGAQDEDLVVAFPPQQVDLGILMHPRQLPGICEDCEPERHEKHFVEVRRLRQVPFRRRRLRVGSDRKQEHPAEGDKNDIAKAPRPHVSRERCGNPQLKKSVTRPITLDAVDNDVCRPIDL
eukprot:CAMPEP_0178385806 /NCGR_PEP_ID=MMETSP0689_2-20121128/8220_1 /TAXON_ID=160604 /ORGANISM="Amphidinium massartii, Strain CS-259" /LENGTH=133 /DNA_ID=CAMNT_0020006095 /DNA_START=909 /DNA_END=1310 /DNA_ORIENTATION=+